MAIAAKLSASLGAAQSIAELKTAWSGVGVSFRNKWITKEQADALVVERDTIRAARGWNDDAPAPAPAPAAKADPTPAPPAAAAPAAKPTPKAASPKPPSVPPPSPAPAPTADQARTADFWAQNIARATSAAELVRTVKAVKDDQHTGRLTQDQMADLLARVTMREQVLKSATPAQRGEADEGPPDDWKSDADEGS